MNPTGRSPPSAVTVPDNAFLVGVLHRTGKVHDGEQKKYERLYEGDKNTHGHDRQRGKESPGQHE